MEDKFTFAQVKKISDLLFIKATEENGGKCFFEGIPRKTPEEFFEDVKYWLGNHYGIYIWDFEYEEAAS